MKKLFVPLLILLVFSCSNEKDTQIPAKDNSPYHLDLTNANQLLVFQNDKSLKNNLFKITKSGSFEQVHIVYEENQKKSANPPTLKGSESEDFIVWYLYKLNDYLLIMQGWFMLNGVQYYSILVNTKDGSIYNFVDKVDDRNFGYHHCYSFQSIGDSIYYYMSLNDYETLKKLNISDLNNITIQDALPYGQHVQKYVVDPFGNIMYGDECANVTKLYLPTQGGRIEKIYDNASYCSNFFLGLDKNFYHGYTDGSIPYINKINIESQTVSKNLIWTGVQWDNNGNLNHRHWILYKKSSILFVNFVYRIAWEFFEETQSVAPVPIPNCDIKFITATDDYLYIADDENIFKISLVTYECIELTNNQFEIYSISVSEDNNISFSGLKYSTGTCVVGKIDPDGNLNIVNNEIQTPATILIKIN